MFAVTPSKSCFSIFLHYWCLIGKANSTVHAADLLCLPLPAGRVITLNRLYGGLDDQYYEGKPGGKWQNRVQNLNVSGGLL